MAQPNICTVRPFKIRSTAPPSNITPLARFSTVCNDPHTPQAEYYISAKGTNHG